ncbi:MAG: hypothetical protein ACI9JL_004517 [Paracoccaceae bacterium]|jgi:hypothetical protein
MENSTEIRNIDLLAYIELLGNAEMSERVSGHRRPKVYRAILPVESE